MLGVEAELGAFVGVVALERIVFEVKPSVAWFVTVVGNPHHHRSKTDQSAVVVVAAAPALGFYFHQLSAGVDYF